jgi:hypothetical protein
MPSRERPFGSPAQMVRYGGIGWTNAQRITLIAAAE